MVKDKKFKEYDRKYRKLVGKGRDLIKPEDKDFIQTIECWTSIVQVPTQDIVQYAVYEAPDHEQWQMFRVSLKGLSTKEKLWLLWLRVRNTDNELEKVRIYNYLLALVRGGQLNESFVIVR